MFCLNNNDAACYAEAAIYHSFIGTVTCIFEYKHRVLAYLVSPKKEEKIEETYI